MLLMLHAVGSAVSSYRSIALLHGRRAAISSSECGQ